MNPTTLKITEFPTLEPVTLNEAKDQLGLLESQTDFDSMLEAAISTARRVIEQRLGRSLIATKYRAKWPSGVASLHLPGSPVLVDETHTLTITVGTTALAADEYELEADAMPAEITLDSRAADDVTVEYWGGVASADDIEPQIKSAALMYVEHLFNHRGVMADGGQVEVPYAFEMLLACSSHSGLY